MKIVIIPILTLTMFCFFSGVGMFYLDKQLNYIKEEVKNLQKDNESKGTKIGKLSEQVSLLESSVSPQDKRWAKIKQVRKAIQNTSSSKLSIVELTNIASHAVDYTEEFDISLALMLSVFRQESAFKKDAVSKAGARGIGQLMPKTAEECAADIGVRHYNVFKTKDNIRLSTYYMWKMLDTFEGNVSLAIKAYNAGPTLTSKIEAGEVDLRLDCDQDGKVDSKYPCETKFYEQIVLRWKKEYEDKYGLH